ncbi:MAG: hypothetical protein PVF68_10185 [Acidobacteriota bacterium]
MRRALLALALAVLVVPAVAAGQDTYYVVLRDGAWVRAAAKPSVEDGVARIRLTNGLLAEIEASRIDWQASESRSQQMRAAVLFKPVATQKPQSLVRGDIPGTLTIVNRPSEAPAPAPSTRTTPAPEMAEDPSASVRGRISTLDQGIAELQERQRDLRNQAAGSYNLDEAEKLRAQADRMEKQIQTLREEKERLLKQLWSLQQP